MALEFRTMHKIARGSHPSGPTGSLRLAVGLRSGAELLVRNRAWAYRMLYREVVAASMPLLALCMLPWDTPADQICADASGVVHLANIAPAKRRSLSLQKKALRAASIRRLRPQVEGLSQMLTLALDDHGVVRSGKSSRDRVCAAEDGTIYAENIIPSPQKSEAHTKRKQALLEIRERRAAPAPAVPAHLALALDAAGVVQLGRESSVKIKSKIKCS